MPPAAPPQSRNAWLAFAVGMALYVIIFLTRIEDFPGYFFCDEAVGSVAYHDLRNNHWHAVHPPNELLPAYFRNVRKYSLSLSVYLQGFATQVFGSEVAVVRALSVWASALAVLAIAMFLRVGFQIRGWWMTPALLAAVPCWFLHERTGFEGAFLGPALAGFLTCYLLYRTRHPAWILATAASGAAAFYSYGNGQGMMLVLCLLLLAGDWRFHLRNGRWALVGFAVGLLLFYPYVRFRLMHPGMLGEHFSDVSTYLTLDIPWWEKVWTYVRLYGLAFNPFNWFTPVSGELQRHRAVFYPHFLPVLFPFLVAGLFGLWQRRSTPAAWLTVAALAAAPATGALAGFDVLGIVRVLPMVIPMTIIIALGWQVMVDAVQTRWLRLAAVGLSSATIWIFAVTMAIDCIALGTLYPFGTREISMVGMQWGAQAIFRDELPPYDQTLPKSAHVFVSHAWANAPDSFPPFFGWGRVYRPITLASMGQLLAEESFKPTCDDLVVVSAQEYASAMDSPLVREFRVLRRIRYPEGNVAFVIGHLCLKENSAAIRADEKQRLAAPVRENVVLLGVNARLTSSGLDGLTGSAIVNSGSTGVLGRCFPGIPLRLDWQLDEPVGIGRIRLRHWEDGDVNWRIHARLAGNTVFARSGRFLPGRDPGYVTSLELPETARIDSLEIELTAGEVQFIHLRGIDIEGPGAAASTR